METLVLTTRNGIRLSAELFTPHVQQNVKHAVVMCHGLGSNKHSQILELLRERILAESISTLAFDFTSHGRSSGSRRRNFTISQQLRDINAVFEYLKGVGYTKFSLVGHSLGGTAAFVFASETNTPIDTTVLIAPRFDFPFLHFRNLPLFWFDQIQYSFERRAQNLQVPILFVKASNDELVNNAVVDRVFDTIASKKKTLVSLETDHRFCDTTSRNTLIDLCARRIIQDSE